MRSTLRIVLLLALVGVVGCSASKYFSVPEFRKKQPLLRPLWQVKLRDHELLQYKPRELAVPAYDAKRRLLVVGSNDRAVYGIDAASGRLRWKTKLADKVRTGLSVHADMAFCGTSGGRLVVLSLADGRVLWTYETQGEVLTRPLVEGGRVYFLTANNHLYAIDLQKHKPAWVYRRSQPSEFSVFGGSRPLIESGKIYAGFADGVFAALSVVDGAVVWARRLSTGSGRFQDVDGSPVVDGSTIYVTSQQGGLYALNTDNGDVIWQTKLPALGSPILRGDHLYLTTGPNELIAVLKKDGTIAWRTKFVLNPNYGLSDPEPVGDKLFLSTTDGIAIVDRLQGSVLEKIHFTKGVSANLFVRGGNLYFISNGGHVYSFAIR
ncbi:MAG: PQQ-like beta-propeller repeat protein [Myxococcales bacterium]|nr:PQQ-like beta-propeller repeat protein [Myxococcales bacterium]